MSTNISSTETESVEPLPTVRSVSSTRTYSVPATSSGMTKDWSMSSSAVLVTVSMGV